MAVDLTSSTEVLDWWLTKSGLPFNDSAQALHTATVRKDIRVLDWWLSAFKNGSVPELKYDEWIMALASAQWKVDTVAGKVVGAYTSSQPFPADQVKVLQWWDKSGLDLKLPSPQVIAEKGIPSPIDTCADAAVLEFWVWRAQPLACAGSSSSSASAPSIASCFPHYTSVALHRAAYRDMVQILEWWFVNATSIGLSLKYLPHRMLELAAMSPNLVSPVWTRTSSLKWLLSELPDTRFRGSLLEWAEVGADAQSSALRAKRQKAAIARVSSICAARGIDPVNGGGMLELSEGFSSYIKQEQGEKLVFFPLL